MQKTKTMVIKEWLSIISRILESCIIHKTNISVISEWLKERKSARNKLW